MGYQLRTKDYALRRRIYKYTPSPFLSVVSSSENIFDANPYQEQHQIMHKNLHFRSIQNRIPFWIQVINNDNLANTFSNGKFIGYYNEKVNKLFKININKLEYINN